MGKSKKSSKIEGTGARREKEIIKKLNDLSDEIHEHQHIHGGKIDIAGAFKKLGSTIKHGFEDKIIHPVEDKIIKPAQAGFNKDIVQGFQNNIINPIQDKIIKPAESGFNKDVIQGFQNKIINPVKNDIIPTAQKEIVPLANQVGQYITRKKGGLASDLLHRGVPIVTGTLAGAAAEALFPEAGPVAGFVGNQAGKYGGTKLADYIGNKYGVGVGTKRRGRPPKVKAGDLVHIDIGSHNAKGNIEGDGLKLKGKRKTSLEQLIENHREKERKELQKNLLDISRNIKTEQNLIKKARRTRADSDDEATGSGIRKFKKESPKGRPLKGSQEAKDHMAKIRAMRGKK